jgi:hypothetical protein
MVIRKLPRKPARLDALDLLRQLDDGSTGGRVGDPARARGWGRAPDIQTSRWHCHEAGLIRSQTTVVTTVHPLQVVDEDLPEAEHDFSVDLIVTPHDTITCGRPRRPTRLVRENLSEEKIAAIPVLQVLATAKKV